MFPKSPNSYLLEERRASFACANLFIINTMGRGRLATALASFRRLRRFLLTVSAARQSVGASPSGSPLALTHFNRRRPRRPGPGSWPVPLPGSVRVQAAADLCQRVAAYGGNAYCAPAPFPSSPYSHSSLPLFPQPCPGGIVINPISQMWTLRLRAACTGQR